MERPIRIRERRAQTSVPVEIVAPQATPRLPRPPIVVFRYGGRLVVCDATWSESGHLIAITFPCPLCTEGRVLRIDGPGFELDETTGRFSVPGTCIQCSAECGLRVHIEGGIAMCCPQTWQTWTSLW